MTSDVGSASAEESQEAIRGLLEPGERLLWSGRPRGGVILRASDGIAIPFSLVWAGFAVFWEWQVLHSPKAPGFFAIWGVPFIAVGLYLVFGRFIVDAYQRSRTSYAVSDRRVLIVTSRNARTLGLEGLTEIALKDSPSGEGTLTFGRDEALGRSGFVIRGWPGGGAAAPAFEGIPDAKSVLGIIRGAQRKLESAR